MEEEYEELRMSYDRYRCLVHDEKHLLLYIKECLEMENWIHVSLF